MISQLKDGYLPKSLRKCEDLLLLSVIYESKWKVFGLQEVIDWTINSENNQQIDGWFEIIL